MVISDRPQQIKVIDDPGKLPLTLSFDLGSQQRHIFLCKNLLQSSLYPFKVLVALIMGHTLRIVQSVSDHHHQVRCEQVWLLQHVLEKDIWDAQLNQALAPDLIIEIGDQLINSDYLVEPLLLGAHLQCSLDQFPNLCVAHIQPLLSIYLKIDKFQVNEQTWVEQRLNQC